MYALSDHVQPAPSGSQATTALILLLDAAQVLRVLLQPAYGWNLGSDSA